GQGTFWNHAEGDDGHDLIEYLAVQDWCNGKVGLSGVSYLAIAQWFIASTQPLHLAAINPWEGVSDVYREFAFHAGIPDSFFVPLWNSTGVNSSLTRVEDMVEMMKKHPLWDGYWETKRARLKNITAPAYVVASWTDQGLHTRGTLEGFKQIASRQKWLEIHGRKKWAYFYEREPMERLREFFDHFLLGKPSGVLSWPRVRFELRERLLVGEMCPADEWPLRGTRYEPLFLDTARAALSHALPADESWVEYDSTGGAATFDLQFETRTDLVGH